MLITLKIRMKNAERGDDCKIGHHEARSALHHGPALRRNLKMSFARQRFSNVPFALDRPPWSSEKITNAFRPILSRRASAKRICIRGAVGRQREVAPLEGLPAAKVMSQALQKSNALILDRKLLEFVEDRGYRGDRERLVSLFLAWLDEDIALAPKPSSGESP
jgi:hypothetical protein